MSVAIQSIYELGIEPVFRAFGFQLNKLVNVFLTRT